MYKVKSLVWSFVLILSVPGVAGAMCLFTGNSDALWTLGEHIQCKLSFLVYFFLFLVPFLI